MNGAELIQHERLRQVTEEQWDDDHDDQHDACQMAQAAVAYIGHVMGQVNGDCQAEDRHPVPQEWPWENEWWKPAQSPIRNLVKAGALIAAEIDRLQRAAVDGRDDDVADFTVSVTVRRLMDLGVWDQFCSLRSVDPWAVNEGLLQYTESFELTEREAKHLGLITA